MTVSDLLEKPCYTSLIISTSLSQAVNNVMALSYLLQGWSNKSDTGHDIIDITRMLQGCNNIVIS